MQIEKNADNTKKADSIQNADSAKKLDDNSKIILALQEGNIIIKPEGYSMYPLFVPKRDMAVITKADTATLKRGDVVLYRRWDSSGILVLHRIVRITKKGFYMAGANQTHIEGPLQAEQIHGKLIEIIRNGKSISVENIVYRVLSFIWLCLRPVRRPISVAVAFIKKKVFHKIHFKREL